MLMSEFCGKRVLITGATGLIGYNLVSYFLGLGDVEVVALSRSAMKLEDCFGVFKNNKMLKMIASDISDYNFEGLCPIDIIYHAAGSMEGDTIKKMPVSVIKPNIIGTIKCLEYLLQQEQKCGKRGRFVCFSSITVYSNNTDSDLVVCEDDTGNSGKLSSSSACYFESKRMAEVIVNSYVSQYGIDAVIARLSTVYGPTCLMPNTAFYSFVSSVLNNQDIIINSEKLPKRDNIYVDDAISGLITITLKGIVGNAYNISSCGDKGNMASIVDIATIFSSESKKRNMPCGVLSKASSSPGLMLSNQKLKSLGWELNVNIVEGVSKTLDYYINRNK